MSEATVRLARDVARLIVELQPLLAEHLDDNYGELLPHVFFGDVTRWATDQDAGSSSLARLLAYLDAIFSEGEDAVQELIAVSFLENLPAGSHIVRMLGPNLAAELSNLNAGNQSKDTGPVQ